MSECARKVCREIWNTVYRPSIARSLCVAFIIAGGLCFWGALVSRVGVFGWGNKTLELLKGAGQAVLPVAGVGFFLVAVMIGHLQLRKEETVWISPRYARTCRLKIRTCLKEQGIDSWKKFDMLLAEVEESLKKNQEKKKERRQNAAKAFFACAWVPTCFLFAQSFGKIYETAPLSDDTEKLQQEVNAMFGFTTTFVLYAFALGVIAAAISWIVTEALQTAFVGETNRMQCVAAYLKDIRYQSGEEEFGPHKDKPPLRVRVRARRKAVQAIQPCRMEKKEMQAEQPAATV